MKFKVVFMKKLNYKREGKRELLIDVSSSNKECYTIVNLIDQ